jgi:hypothetical protein
MRILKTRVARLPGGRWGGGGVGCEGSDPNRLRPSPWHPEGIPRGWERVPGLHMRALTRWRGGRPPMGATSRLAHRQKVTHIGSPTLRPTCAAPEKWSGCVWWSYTTSVGVGCELGRAGWCLTTAALCALSLSLSPAHVSVKL